MKTEKDMTNKIEKNYQELIKFKQRMEGRCPNIFIESDSGLKSIYSKYEEKFMKILALEDGFLIIFPNGKSALCKKTYELINVYREYFINKYEIDSILETLFLFQRQTSF